MTIAELIHGLPITLVRGSDSTIISDIVEDSRRATKGCLFVARGGERLNGAEFVTEAVASGAVAVLLSRTKEEELAPPSGGPAPQWPTAVVVADDVPGVLGPLAERFHGNPGDRLRLVGVTGTNGKTTIAHLIHQTLTHAGVRAGLIGTVVIDDGRRVRPAELTTPPALKISRLLRAMVANSCTAAVAEVSSHGLVQGRVAGLRFQAAVFTNLAGDHLDYHSTRRAYGDAKAMLFASLGPEGWAIVNVDDPAAGRMVRDCPGRVLACSVTDPAADCFGRSIRSTFGFTEASLDGPWGSFVVRLPLVGEHNLSNALEAAAACYALGLEPEALPGALALATPPPGRLERVSGPGDTVSVMVDYAHTDDALAHALRTLRPLMADGRAPGRLRVVFGCGGDRDRSKRPRMGQVAARLADELIVTSDNPRTEEPGAIIDQIIAGIPARRLADTTRLTCRREAITYAITHSRPGDLVLIAGKGHETYQIIGTRRRPFDDRQVATEALANLRGGG